MRSKFLALLAVMLLAGPGAANAAYLYSFQSPDDGLGTRTADFKFVATSLLAVSTTIAASDLFDVTPYFGPAPISVQFLSPGSTTPQIKISFADGAAVTDFNWPGPFDHMGTYVHRSGDILNISTFNVPEPGTLALFCLSLLGLTLSRRRKAA